MDPISFILHIDQHLATFLVQYGAWLYVILFLIIFVETGLVVMPFLPGDSLLFAAGALAAFSGNLDLSILIGVMFTAAVLGDSTNYHIGKYIGPKVFERDSKWINRKHLLNTQQFFAKHGGKTIVMARFLPFARTFAPFVAGAGSMNYKYFFTYSVMGGLLWISSLTTLGYFFGNQPVIKNNFTYVVFGIIGFSILPMIIGFIRNKLKSNKAE